MRDKYKNDKDFYINNVIENEKNSKLFINNNNE